ncbi:MAG: zinc ribbon domain-containing protein, partial [Candidatus Korobacteraceae bacterium]
MICSTCGYESPMGHRFCGMCGTPLPHRPLTAPGAQSTLSMTRVPLEQGGTLRPPSAALTQTGVLTDAGNSEPPMDLPGTAAMDIAADSEESPPKELVPDLPLDEYVKTFHYEPPAEPTEVTMRGDASVEQMAIAETNATAASTAEIPASPADAPPVSGSIST